MPRTSSRKLGCGGRCGRLSMDWPSAPVRGMRKTRMRSGVSAASSAWATAATGRPSTNHCIEVTPSAMAARATPVSAAASPPGSFTCASLKPGMTARPPRSRRADADEARAATSAVVPTATTRSPRRASASAHGFAGSAVNTWPFSSTVSGAGGAQAPPSVTRHRTQRRAQPVRLTPSRARRRCRRRCSAPCPHRAQVGRQLTAVMHDVDRLPDQELHVRHLHPEEVHDLASLPARMRQHLLERLGDLVLVPVDQALDGRAPRLLRSGRRNCWVSTPSRNHTSERPGARRDPRPCGSSEPATRPSCLREWPRSPSPWSSTRAAAAARRASATALP